VLLWLDVLAGSDQGHGGGERAGAGAGRGGKKIKASRRRHRGVRRAGMARVGAEVGSEGGPAGTWCASSGCRGRRRRRREGCCRHAHAPFARP
jgi:hypothetical protein